MKGVDGEVSTEVQRHRDEVCATGVQVQCCWEEVGALRSAIEQASSERREVDISCVAGPVTCPKQHVRACCFGELVRVGNTG